MDTEARIWDSLTGKLKGTLKGQYREFTTATYSPDGTKILTIETIVKPPTAPSDEPLRNMRLWDASTGELLMTFEKKFSQALFTPDGLKIYGFNGGNVEVFSLYDRVELDADSETK
jgi:WD40 repeat protein